VAALNRAGIPVFTVNVIVSPEDLERQQAEIIQYVGADQVQGGQVMGEAVVEDYGADAEIVYGIVGNPDQIPTNQRDDGSGKRSAATPTPARPVWSTARSTPTSASR
jgi:ribose transport system substrate-binding protein